jgi:6,7-dimethyl-8-ribityllumazine synthase
MSDRFDTPRWDDELEELEELETDDVVAEHEPAGEVGEPDLDASSENVLDGWPAVAEIEDAPEAPATEASAPEVSAFEVSASEAPASEVEPVEAGAPEDLSDAPAPLADHVSATIGHAPGELTVPPGYAVLEGEAAGERRAVGVVVARFNGDVTTQLLASALAELDVCGVDRDAVTVMPVPGAFELPLAAMALAKTRRFACIVALGCVIRGDTPHFDYVSGEAASGLQLAAIETGVPVAFGVLTLDRADQAESRYEKGAEAVRTGLEMADLFANLRAAAAR